MGEETILPENDNKLINMPKHNKFQKSVRLKNISMIVSAIATWELEAVYICKV